MEASLLVFFTVIKQLGLAALSCGIFSFMWRTAAWELVCIYYSGLHGYKEK
jgi:hypothetical protein